MMSLLDDLAVTVKATLFTDASAAIGIVRRAGLGKLRHLNVRYLWLQDQVKLNNFGLLKVPGLENSADLMTKNLGAEQLEKHVTALGMRRSRDRAATAPTLASATIVTNVNGEVDQWIKDCESVTRIHAEPRDELFTPRRIPGAPESKALTNTRITRGTYEGTGETFSIIDTWTQRSTAHRRLANSWTGTTQFVYRVD